jgi:hypothetical protein
MPNEYKCPSCGAAISLDDVNVSKDVALCRACGQSTACSLISAAAEINLQSLAQPPRGIRMEEEPGGALRICYRKISGAVLFLIPFTLFWGGLSMGGIYGSQILKRQFSLTQSLFGIPFLIGTIVLLSIISYLLFGKWVITLNEGAGTVFMGIGSLGWTRRFAYDRSTVVCLRVSKTQYNTRRYNYVPQKAISVRTGENELLFGTMIPDEAKQFIAAAIVMRATQSR